MIRIGDGKPKLEIEYGDSHHPLKRPKYYVENCAWVGLDRWMQIRDFQEYDFKKAIKAILDSTPNKVDREEWMKIILNKVYEGKVPHPFTALGNMMQMNYLLKLSGGSTCWQMNIANYNLSGYIRTVIIMGEERYRRWTWVDAHIKRNWYRLVASIKNKW